MAFIDVVEWSPTTNDIYAWRFPESNLSTATQLIVRESQEAVFFSKGQILGKFGPGKHQLTTENLPLLRNLYGIPFGGTNPFFAEVWFVNKTMPLTIDWRTTSMRIMDPQYGAMVPIAASGRYGVQVRDAEKFLVKLIGTMREFTSRNLTDHFMGPLVSKTNSAIASYMSANGVGITQISMQLDQLGQFIGQPMAQFWDEYGMELKGFYITSIDVDTTTDAGRKISEALTERSAQNIAGYTWQQRQSFEVANNAVNGTGDMGILGMAMMTGMFGGSGNGAANGMMSQPAQTGFNAGPGFGQQLGPQGAGAGAGMGAGAQPRAQVFCANCGKPYSSSMRFCPSCGHEYNPCPLCGSDNHSSAHRCVTCGAELSSNSASYADTTCPRCRTIVQLGTRFCPQCGARLS